ncbi:flavin-containing monooxygenase 5-like [Uloborus diversus]|uniref:flavin-containing monooxygenase 5-like n=1 Tax=Uloborus diversus TaxID=327109 RepID=UPI002409BFF3|nr:flavin-containing monooxygenase 5-like [Uloborus diversus]XP_054708621.1 flavin-containing monooxygenase 5-like [Uloborus diversus]
MGRKRIAVVGVGPCGICAIKSLKEEGMEPVGFERTNTVGGLWRYHDDDVEGLASVMKTTIINSSKEMSAVSDFPPREDTPNYMHNREVYAMLTSYAKAFDVIKHVNFHKEVIEVDLAESYEETGRVVVSVKDTITGEISKDEYDGVFVNIGHHVYPNMPSFPGMEIFKGKIMHTHSLKNVDSFEDQVVVVVGAGNSGMDAAVEISSVSRQVYLSTRSGTWVLPRVGPNGLPIDVVLTRRFTDMLFKKLPYDLICWISEKVLNYRFDHEIYSLKPKHRIWSQHPTVSDTLPIKLLSGTVVVRKNIEKFVENGVIFQGEDQVTECDTVVFATGYKIKFPFLSDKITTIKNNQVHLYKYVFPPHLKHPTVAILGLIQSVGAGFPVGEAQCRWASLVMNGKCFLPSREEMEADIKKKKEINLMRYGKSERHTIQVDYIEYIDEITALFGAKPNLLKIFFTDPRLFFVLMFGPSLPYQYRLQGPHSWSGARKAILEWDKRVIKPLKRDYQGQQFNVQSFLYKLFVVGSAMLLLISILIKVLF